MDKLSYKKKYTMDHGIWYQVLQLLHSIMSPPVTSGILQIQ